MSHFFKVVLSKTLQDGKLKIPPRFVKRFAPSLQSKLVVLEDPNGEKWEVKLKKLNNGDDVIWYLCGQGWSDFADYYSLKHGHLIVFNYQENSHFHVVICDDTATEIHYPTSINNNIPTTHIDDGDDDDDDDSVQTLDIAPPVSHKAAGKGTTNPTHHHIGCSTSKVAAKNLKTRAGQRAEANFEFENPFFSLVLKPTYVDGGRYMNLPRDFVEKYMKDEDVDQVVLGSSDGRTWPVKYLYQTIMEKPNGKFTSGWAKFAMDNDLIVGDLCVFELIKKLPKQFHFQVWVFL